MPQDQPTRHHLTLKVGASQFKSPTSLANKSMAQNEVGILVHFLCPGGLHPVNYVNPVSLSPACSWFFKKAGTVLPGVLTDHV